MSSSRKKQYPIVPVIYYHSIADVNDGWLFRHLSCPVSTFESHLKAIRRSNYQTISLLTLYEYMADGKQIPKKSLVLTFDDGYLDNWVFAFPLLKKYGLLATIFVNPEFVDPSEKLRPNLEDAWAGRIAADDLPTNGFLSWQEMREMERSGFVDIQSHGLTHTWYFSSPEMIDFHHPGDKYPWLAWNARPECKYQWMTEDQQNFVPWGVPVYKYAKSLATRRYFPDQNLELMLAEYVRNRGNERFFEEANWYTQLLKVSTDYNNDVNNGYYETDDEYRRRLHHELAGSKQIIEKELGKKVNFLCWPGGGYNDLSVEISKEVGYLSSEITSRNKVRRKNQYSQDPSRWTRIFPPNFHWSDTHIEYKGGIHMICLLNSVRGSILYTIIFKALRLPFKLIQWFHHQ